MRPNDAAGVVLGLLLLSACRSEHRGPVELTFWAFGAEGERVQQLLPGFERENPGIRVRAQQVPWTAAHEKLLTSYVGEATPDIAQLGNTWVPELAAIDAIAPLDARVAASPAIDPSDFFAGIWNTNVVHDTVYGIPWYVDTRVLFYRTDILHAAGYDAMPATWSEWKRALERIQRQAAPGHYAIFLPTDEWAQPVIFGMQAGSPLLKDDGRYAAFADSAFRRGFDFYLSLFRDGLAPVYSNANVGNVYEEFARGTLAMWITGPWNIGEFQRRLPDSLRGKWMTAPLPGPDGDSSRTSLAGGSSLVLFRRSPHQAEAWKLVEYLARPDVQLRFYQLTGDLPARVESWRDTALANNRYAAAFREQLRWVRPLPKVPEVELILTRLIDYSERAIRGRAPAGQVLTALDREVDQLLEKRRWMMDRRATR